MKKIGIVTINDFNNYGNRVQCYAVQEYLKKMGYISNNIYNRGLSRREFIKRKIKNYIKYICGNENVRKLYKRSAYFKTFNKNIDFSNYKIINGKTSKKLNNKYDYFIVGSDQVWNPNFNTTSDADFLLFADENKRIAFSASFGVSEIPNNKLEYYRKNLSQFKAISVREDMGKNIVNDLTGRNDVEVLIDPTMLLTAEEWDKVAKKPEKLTDEKYILCYFLGNLSDKKKQEIERIAKEKNYKIINILDKNDVFYISGPSEFLYLEKNAQLICTDSFHSCVFAILYNKPFIVFDRDDKMVNMNTRIETLISKFKLENRTFNGKITKENLEHDYTKAFEILENERKKSREFLKNNLK